MNQSLQHPTQHEIDDEINLWGILDFVIAGWRWWVGGACLGLISAFGFLFLTPPLYESTAIIQPASIGNTGMTKVPVEPVAQLLERLKFPTFYTDEIVNTCQEKDNKALSDALKPSLIKGNTLILIKFRADSTSVSRDCLFSVFSLLKQSQADIAAPLIDELEKQRDLTKKQVDELERFLAQYDKTVTQLNTSTDIASLLFLNAESKREGLLKLQKIYNEQRTQLTQPLTQPLMLTEKIYVSEKPVFPKKTLTVLGGLAGGLFSGLILLFVYHSWRKFRARA